MLGVAAAAVAHVQHTQTSVIARHVNNTPTTASMNYDKEADMGG